MEGSEAMEAKEQDEQKEQVEFRAKWAHLCKKAERNDVTKGRYVLWKRAGQ